MTKDQMKLVERLSEEYAARATHSGLGKPSVSFLAGATNEKIAEMYRCIYREEAMVWAAKVVSESNDNGECEEYMLNMAKAERERLAALLGEGEIGENAE